MICPMLLMHLYWWLIRQMVHHLDYTFLMENPSFETGDLSPWMATQGYDTGVKPNTGDFSFSGADGNYLFNTWNGSAIDFNVAQTVTNLRDGLYRLRCIGCF